MDHPSPGAAYLNGVTATSASNVWAAGDDIGSCACNKALILHWTGQAWKVVVNSFASSQSILYSAAALSGSSAWAGGFTHYTENMTLAMRWNGTSWTRI